MATTKSLLVYMQCNSTFYSPTYHLGSAENRIYKNVKYMYIPDKRHLTKILQSLDSTS